MTTTTRTHGLRLLSASIPMMVTTLWLTGATAQAAPVTIGSLSSNDDGATTVITDTATGRQYLRWDQLLGLTYAQTQAAIADSTNVAYGFSFARNQQAQDFVNALLSPNSHACAVTDVTGTMCQSGANANFVKLVGDNYYFNAVPMLDYAFFLSDNAVGQDVGIMELDSNPDPVGYLGGVYKSNEWSNFAFADFFANRSDPIVWLLYRDAPPTPVPEPTSMLLLGTGLAGIATRLRRRQ